MKALGWKVYQSGRLLDIVFMNSHAEGGAKITADDVRTSLINHDGYSSTITVTLDK